MKRLFLLATTALAAATVGCAQQPATTAPTTSLASTNAAALPAQPQPQPSAAVRDAQQQLRQLGYYEGAVDGLNGPATEQAILRFQRSRGLDATGQLNTMTASAMRDDAASVRTAAAKPVELSDPTTVRTVQNRLRQLGFYDGPADGVWGPGTQQALERFQRARGIDRVGEPTGATMSAMGIDPGALAHTASAAEPLDPTVVRGIQQRLRRLGFYKGPLDGAWGAGSQAAVERFQRARGLQPTGDLNPTTLAALGFDPNNLATGASPTRGSVARR